jgi:hypothetical protein
MTQHRDKGEDETTDGRKLAERLQSEIGRAQWSDLRAHAARGGLFLLGETLPLLDAALAVAADEVKLVEGWMKAGLLRRPTAGEVELWSKHPELPFDSVIVQPFVLVRRADQD